MFNYKDLQIFVILRSSMIEHVARIFKYSGEGRKGSIAESIKTFLLSSSSFTFLEVDVFN